MNRPERLLPCPAMFALVLPYLDLPSLPLPFGLSLHPFGVFAALGAYLGARLVITAGRVYAPGDTRPLSGVFSWAIGGGILGAHLLHVLGYHPELLRTEGPWVLLKVWDGVSSMGGVLGGLAGIALFFRVHHLPVRPYWDALALGTAPAGPSRASAAPRFTTTRAFDPTPGSRWPSPAALASTWDSSTACCWQRSAPSSGSSRAAAGTPAS